MSVTNICSSGSAAFGAQLRHRGRRRQHRQRVDRRLQSSRAGFSDVMGGMIGSTRMGRRPHGRLADRPPAGRAAADRRRARLAVRGRGFFVVEGTMTASPAPSTPRRPLQLDNEGSWSTTRACGCRLRLHAGRRAEHPPRRHAARPGSGRAPRHHRRRHAAQSGLDGDLAGDVPDHRPERDLQLRHLDDRVRHAGQRPSRGHVLPHRRRRDLDWHALVDGGELNGGIEGQAVEIASGSLTFNTSGALDIETVNARAPTSRRDARPGGCVRLRRRHHHRPGHRPGRHHPVRRRLDGQRHQPGRLRSRHAGRRPDPEDGVIDGCSPTDSAAASPAWRWPPSPPRSS